MIIERNPPITCEELNETQMQMLKQCDIPGLLSLDTAEVDGQLTLRYLLSGNRMLSEMLRSTYWSMNDMMGALCRLGEVLEECRLYLLDADRIRLQDEYIFVGQDWFDLKFTYIPIDMPTLHKIDDLERLIIRWMLKVKEPDGQVIQHVLRLVATKGFLPISLSRYAREYLANALDTGNAASVNTQMPPLSVMPKDDSHSRGVAKASPILAKPLKAWDIFQPPTGDPHTDSEMWGDEGGLKDHQLAGLSATTARDEEVMPITRWRMILFCTGLILLSAGWRFLYLTEQSEQRLLFCLCLSLVITAGILFLWKGFPRWSRISSESIRNVNTTQSKGFEDKKSEVQEMAEYSSWSSEPRFPQHLSHSNPKKTLYGERSSLDVQADKPIPVSETTWLAIPNDRTTFLQQEQIPLTESHYLLWENKGAPSERIPLQGHSFIIGRASDAATHVDPSVGISRAHAELVKVSKKWKVKDLGSRNGSKLNDQPMAPYELYPLHTGDNLTLGSSQYHFQK
jgi:hypothetical protein